MWVTAVQAGDQRLERDLSSLSLHTMPGTQSTQRQTLQSSLKVDTTTPPPHGLLHGACPHQPGHHRPCLLQTEVETSASGLTATCHTAPLGKVLSQRPPASAFSSFVKTETPKPICSGCCGDCVPGTGLVLPLPRPLALPITTRRIGEQEPPGSWAPGLPGSDTQTVNHAHTFCENRLEGSLPGCPSRGLAGASVRHTLSARVTDLSPNVAPAGADPRAAP